ncbi:hypothetical protein [Tepidiforma sp.]|uniref:hypothetical protein n=1 Tax=Tepidiforma sp. TaxID=2682230 RepID=UPI002ADE151C|nr:hypothetical protein [Tepidiforma sp.]
MREGDRAVKAQRALRVGPVQDERENDQPGLAVPARAKGKVTGQGAHMVDPGDSHPIATPGV